MLSVLGLVWQIFYYFVHVSSLNSFHILLLVFPWQFHLSGTRQKAPRIQWLLTITPHYYLKRHNELWQHHQIKTYNLAHQERVGRVYETKQPANVFNAGKEYVCTKPFQKPEWEVGIQKTFRNITDLSDKFCGPLTSLVSIGMPSATSHKEPISKWLNPGPTSD